MSDSSNARREKRGWFRRSRPIDVSELMHEPGALPPSRTAAPARPPEGRPKRSADMFRGVENGDAWSSSAWAEDGWDDDWSDPTSKRASVRPAADPRPEEVDAWLESPALVLLAETDGYWTRLRRLLQAGKVIGPKVHDARIAALCAQHGVRELWSADRDFNSFPGFLVTNPLVG